MRYASVYIIVILIVGCAALVNTSFVAVNTGEELLDKECVNTSVKSKEICLDCTFRGLTRVPRNLSQNISCLNLVGNNIVHITGTEWGNYPFLKKLSLAKNKLTSLNENSFDNLYHLEMLDLSLNRIRYTGNSISENAFKPLKALVYLDIKQNFTTVWENETYPASLQYLGKLETLMIDGLYGTIPTLPKLKDLYLSGAYGRCHIPNLTKLFFENITQVESLYLSNCSIETMEKQIYQVWPNIVQLDLSWNTKLGLRNISIGMHGSNLTRLKKINLNSIYKYFKFDMCSSLLKEDLTYLTHTPLEVFTLESNNLVRMEKEAVINFPKTVKYVSVKDNMLMYGQYVDILYQKHIFKNLKYYDTSQMFMSHTPNDFVHNDTMGTSYHHVANTLHEVWKERDTGQEMFTRSCFKDYFQILDDKTKKFNISPDNDTHYNDTNSNKIEYIDLSENMPGTIAVTMKLFENSPLMKVLNLSNNYLGYDLLDNNNNAFSNYSSLKVLDLSKNGIITLLPRVFQKQNKLQKLYLSYNKLFNLTFVEYCIRNGYFEFLDVSSNHLQDIPKEIRTQFNMLTNFTIDISDNNFMCTCDNLDFVSWVKYANITFRNRDNTNCSFENNTLTSFSKLDFGSLRSECSSRKYYILILIVSLGIVLFLVVVGCGLVYRFKWNLRYLYYMTKMKLIGGYEPISNGQFEKDVFVSYANEDCAFVRQHVLRELEDMGGFSLIVHNRDFLAGDYIADNIMKAVTTSRKTLVILTRSYLKSKWCMYEMNMARMEAIDTGRNVLCVILKEDIPAKYLPLEVTEVLKTKTYIEYPTDQEHMVGFWERLRATLQHDI